jgi:hypothetical protein
VFVVLAHTDGINGSAGKQQGFDDGRLAGSVMGEYSHVADLVTSIFFHK